MIQTYVAYSKPTRPTGRDIARELGCTNWGVRDPGDEIDVLVRWGSSRPMRVIGCEINNAKGIRTAADKIATFEAMEKGGVPVPPWHREAEKLALNTYARSGTWFLARQNFKTKARGLVPFRWGRDPVPPADFYTFYMKPHVEYRIHVVDGKVVRVQGKYCDYPEQAETNKFVRNHETGYRYRAPRERLHRTRTDGAISAVKALGLDFGAVDLMLHDSGNYYVFEVNTGPACSPLTRRCYVAAIAGLVRDRTDGKVKLAPGIWESAGSNDLEDTVEHESYLDTQDYDSNRWNRR